MLRDNKEAKEKTLISPPLKVIQVREVATIQGCAHNPMSLDQTLEHWEKVGDDFWNGSQDEDASSVRLPAA
ncbi:hypothetical protein M8C21_026420 [Ambrosia artemisiifolia]|uniref:Uncharacterized protein n=1 Tax=Ambrosia artemisiifolia TaxID=4212 RepID=A0AAD5G736_AMBAR|nr:hypothetical protein M8C21_026420 [Ambrosia artemisiifolia]